MDISNSFVLIIPAVLIVLVSYIYVTYFNKKSSTRLCPQAFKSLPIFGSFFFLPPIHTLHVKFMTMTETLGDVYSFYIAGRYTIILNSADLVHEALLKRSSDFASRPNDSKMLDYVNPHRKGIISALYGETFKKSRKLSLSILKSFGFGQTIMEDRIQIEVESLASKFRSMKGASICPNETIMLTVMNVIASILFGKGFQDNDPKLMTMVKSAHGILLQSGKLRPIQTVPLLRFLPRFRLIFKEVLAYQQEMVDICEENITDSISGKAEKGFASCYIEAEGPEYDHEQLMRIMRDLVLAGGDTSATTLQWALVEMANHQDVQKRIQRDIDAVVSRDRLPSLADKSKLPYIEATICEVMRRWTIAPLGVPHSTVCDTEVGGYFVPAETTVITNLYSCHMNPKNWVNPESFNPERFLDSEKNVINKDEIVSFSLGKRSCLGELLARQEIYLFFTGLLQKFYIFPEEGHDKVQYREQVGITLGPVEYKLRLIPRINEI